MTMKAVLLCLLVTVVPAWADGWTYTVVDGGHSADMTGSPIAFVLDSSDHPHIVHTAAFNLPHAYDYAYFDGAEWRREQFDTWPHAHGTFHASVSLTLDSLMRPHVAYEKAGVDTSTLVYAWKAADSWRYDTIATTAPGVYVSLALDSADVPMAAFYSGRPMRDLMFARYNGVDWDIEMVDSQGWTGYFARLVLDDADHPHIAYQGELTMKYASHDGAEWSVETVNSPGYACGYGAALALDSAGRPHISYTSNTFDSSLLYSRHDGNGWVHESVTDAGRASSTSIKLDSQGRPHIVYDYATSDSAGPHDHRYIHFDGAEWRMETVEQGQGYAMDHRLALDRAELPHVAFGRRPAFYDAWLVYARRDVAVEEPAEGSWTGDGLRVPTVLCAPDLVRFEGRVFDMTGRDVTERRRQLVPGVYFLRPVAAPGRKVLVAE
jgi:hypothetical protein